MEIIMNMAWIVAELVFAIVGMVVAKTVSLVWRLVRFVASGGRKAIGPLITADDWDKNSLEVYFGLGTLFWLVLVLVYVL